MNMMTKAETMSGGPSVDELRQVLQSAVPASLIKAEQRVRSLRDEREGIANRLSTLSRELNQKSRSGHDRAATSDETALLTQLSGIDTDIRIARADLHSEREKAAGVIPHAFRQYCRTIAPELELMAGNIERISKLLLIPDQVAQQFALPAPGLSAALRDIPNLLRLANALKG